MFLFYQILIVITLSVFIIFMYKKVYNYEHFANGVELQNRSVFTSLSSIIQFLESYKTINEDNSTYKDMVTENIPYHNKINISIPPLVLDLSERPVYAKDFKFNEIPLLWQSLDSVYQEIEKMKDSVFCQDENIRTLLESRNRQTKEDEAEKTYIKCEKNENNDLNFDIKTGEKQYNGINGLFNKMRMPRKTGVQKKNIRKK